MEITPLEIIVAIIAAAPGIFATIVQIRKWKAEAKKTQAESTKVDMEATGELTETALSLIIPLREENSRLKAEIERLQARLSLVELGVSEALKEKKLAFKRYISLQKGAQKLYQQLIDLGLKPVYEVPVIENGE